MEAGEIENVLSACESRLAAGGKVDLAPLGFWRAVAAVKRNREQTERFAERIGTIDRTAFERWALLKIPMAPGTFLMSAGTVVGLVLIGWAYRLSGARQVLALLAGTGILLVATHGIAHLAVGRLQGMRFTHWFIGTLGRPQPGVKVDYSSYLRVPARSRAWMHASGAIVTKLIPFLSLGAGWAMDAPMWVLVLLAALAVTQIATDVLWSTKKSDWKKFARERAFAL